MEPSAAPPLHARMIRYNVRDGYSITFHSGAFAMRGGAAGVAMFGLAVLVGPNRLTHKIRPRLRRNKYRRRRRLSLLLKAAPQTTLEVPRKRRRRTGRQRGHNCRPSSSSPSLAQARSRNRSHIKLRVGRLLRSQNSHPTRVSLRLAEHPPQRRLKRWRQRANPSIKRAPICSPRLGPTRTISPSRRYRPYPKAATRRWTGCCCRRRV